jgi:uncharacterized protein YaiI (UPF0178 family)
MSAGLPNLSVIDYLKADKEESAFNTKQSFVHIYKRKDCRRGRFSLIGFMTKNPLKIYVDADACPVKDEVIRVAERHQLQTFIVSNGGLRPNPNPLIQNIVVDAGADIADMWIAERAQGGDIVITSDIPLAARALENDATVLRHDGHAFTKDNIGNAIATRDLLADLREANPFQQSFNKPFSKRDRSNFLVALENSVQTNSSRK